MHMADALLTPAVAGVMYAASAVVAGASIVELHKEEKQDLTSAAKKLPTMAVMSALVFAGQMINYTIPGTGSSGHLCGGLLLTSVLGPWAGFLSMIVILTIQCLFFADGGLLALGANVWNMAFYGCFVGYFLIYRPLMRSRCFARRGERAANRLKITLASVLGCVLTLQLGAFSVVLETTLSGITDLPFGAFCAIMQPIHLAIGLIEGLITAAVLYEARPELLRDVRMSGETTGKVSFKGTIAVIAIAAVLVGGGLSLLASGNPDGLEWSLFGNSDAGYTQITVPNLEDTRQVASEFVHALPDYIREVVSALLPVIVFCALFQLIFRRFHKAQLTKIGIGFLYTFIGLALFLTGVNVGFMPAGHYLGQQLALSGRSWLLIPLGMLIGYFLVTAEPAVHVLNRQVENITNGGISQRAMMLSLSIGVACSVGLAMLRVLTGLSIYWVLIPGYAAALIMSRFVPPVFVGIAFDSGGVASGPMTSTFLLPLAMGACSAVGGNVVTDAFGIVALVALAPLIAIQIMGLLYARRTQAQTAPNILDDTVVELEEY